MTLANVAIYVALVIVIVARRMIGRPVGAARQQFVLPVVAIVIGWGDATQGPHKPVDLAFTVAGCALSLVFGLLRGGADRISDRDGVPYVQWTLLSLGLFGAGVLAKLGLDLAGVAAGETFAETGHSLIITLGLTLLGEAAIIWYRSGGPAQLASGQPRDPDHRNARDQT